MENIYAPWYVGEMFGYGKIGIKNDLALNIADVSTPYDNPESVEDIARLVAAAPELLEALEMTYIMLLNLPHGSSQRIQQQALMCIVRDAIAKATGRTSEAVQNEYEEKALRASL